MDPANTQAKKYDRAIAILAKHAWWEKLITVVREVPREDKKDLNTCVQHFRKVRSQCSCFQLFPLRSPSRPVPPVPPCFQHIHEMGSMSCLHDEHPVLVFLGCMLNT
eukprot:1158743-Pelagomonas_calceolata.AAC.18